jgi:hypothetical protein
LNGDGIDIVLEGTLPFEISHLTDMVQFDLLNKDFVGPITNIFSGMTNLRELSLEKNMFTGPIPDTLSDENPLLDTLILEGNKFNGTFPISLTQLPLQVLELAGNKITGFIPSEIGNLIRLGKCGLTAISNLSVNAQASHLTHFLISLLQIRWISGTTCLRERFRHRFTRCLVSK